MYKRQPVYHGEVIHAQHYNEFGAATPKSAIVLTDQFDYEQELLKRSSEQARNIDFDAQTVLLIDMGEKPSGGFNIANVSFTDNEHGKTAHVLLEKPGESCSVTEALTNPYQFIVIDGVDDIVIQEEYQYSDC